MTSRLTLRVRVASLLAGLTGVLLVVGLVSTVAVSHTRDLDRDLHDRLEPASAAVQTLFIAYLDQETGERGYDLTGQAVFYAPFTTGVADANAAVDTLHRLLHDPGSKAELATILVLHQKWLDTAVTPQYEAAKSGNLEQARDLVGAEVGRKAFDAIRQAVRVLRADLVARVDAERRDADAASRRVFVALGVGAVGLLIGIVFAGYLLRRWVLVPTAALQHQLRSVADGGYDQAIVPSGPPELAALGDDAELMRERIVTELDRSRQAIEALYQSGPVVTGLREELAATPALSLAGLALHGVLSAAEGILAGDWYDAVPLAGGRAALLVADVSGHGAAAGLVALRVKLSLTSALSLGLGPAAALTHATTTFAGEGERFASCVVVVIDPLAERLTWANAGHPAPLVYTPADGSSYELEPTGPLLSFFGGDWEERELDFGHGRLLLGYTDGLTEARDAEGRQFEVEGVLSALHGLTDVDPVAAVVACMAAVRSHAVDLRRDDVTVVAVALAD